jgi:hypothetical protein
MLDDYAEDLELQGTYYFGFCSIIPLRGRSNGDFGIGKGKRKKLLYHIKEEIRYPCLDLRKPMTSLSDKELFPIITGESDYTLYVGLKTGCTVLKLNNEKGHFLSFLSSVYCSDSFDPYIISLIFFSLFSMNVKVNLIVL